MGTKRTRGTFGRGRRDPFVHAAQVWEAPREPEHVDEILPDGMDAHHFLHGEAGVRRGKAEAGAVVDHRNLRKARGRRLGLPCHRLDTPGKAQQNDRRTDLADAPAYGLHARFLTINSADLCFAKPRRFSQALKRIFGGAGER